MLATVISRILDPVWEIPLAIVLAVVFAMSEGLRWRFLGLLLFIDAFVPMIFFFTMLYHKQLSNWDMDKRRQRVPIYIFTMLCHLGGLWLAHEAGKGDLFNVLLVFYLTGLIFAGLTVIWKISIHAGVNAVLITAINFFFGWQYWWLYSLLALVMWARVYQKHHTWGQVVAGALLGGGMVGIGLGMM